MTRRFDKYEGLGNDFVVLDGERWPEAELTPTLARQLCDRHTAVGADGVIWVGRTGRGDARMVIYNADGSRPEMCGNGVRCVAAWLADEGVVGDGETVVVESDAGPRAATLRGRERGAWRVGVDMGAAVVSAREQVCVADVTLVVRPVDMGNPHGVLFEAHGDEGGIVRAVTALPVFPRGVNVELVARDGDGFRVRVHERGVGWTQACGTGACAVAAAAVREGYARAGEAVRVTLDGGALSIVVAPDTWRVQMTGPARRAFRGEL